MSGRTTGDGEISLYSEAFGSSTDPPLLLIMGAMSSGVWWPEEFCRRLAGRGRFVDRYDHRDTGRSTSHGPGQAAYSVEDLADDAIRVLDGYSIGGAHLVGMSLGGYLAQIVSLKCPRRMLSLTLIASERLAQRIPNVPAMDPRRSIRSIMTAPGESTGRIEQAVVDYQVVRMLFGLGPSLRRGRDPSDGDRRLRAAPSLLTTFNHATLGGADGWEGRLGRSVPDARDPD